MVGERRCDIVMKGGITSGVVYARAVAELAKTYRFMNVGGTSAGAMAAVVAAACQRARLDGKQEAFATLESIPDWLGKTDKDGNTNLLRLFPPAKRTKPVFALLLAATTHPQQTVPMELALAALRGFRLWALAASIPGLVVIAGTFVAIAPGAGVWRTLLLFVLLLCGVLLTVVGALAGAAGGLLVRMPPALKATLFGTCPGSWIGKEPATPPATDDGKPLTPWLTDVIDRAAGRAETGAPLTFGELWGNDPHAQDVSLQTFTTCLTLGRPFRVPFAADEQFRFKPSEWRRLFPERVVDALAQGADWRAAPDTQLPLPPAAKLPVVVAARLSLSFPVLLSAIPLYDEDGTQHWFSDGGICSNFPLHFFDSPLPRWPTFGLDLQDTTDPDTPPVWMPDTNEAPHPAPEQPVHDITSFGSWIVETAMDWHDNVTAALPGYRDRIATISFQPGEGGLNLNMPQDLIAKLGDRGRDAGAMLAARFTPAWDAPDRPVLSWDNHRWVRYRTALATVEPFLSKLLKGWLDEQTLRQLFPGYDPPTPPPGQRTYAEIAAHPPTQYAGLDPEQTVLAHDVTEAIVHVAEEWIERRGSDLPAPVSPSLDVNAPSPLPDLRISPSQ
jgi:predicted acylesterase/phospholipase RssA